MRWRDWNYWRFPESGMMMENKGLTQSLCKAFEILGCFTPESPVLRVVDITRKVDLTQSNVSRLVNTMVACGYLERLDDSGYFQLGKKIISLSSVALNHSELRKQALPELFHLEQQYGVGANLAVFHEDQMYYLAHVDSRSSPRMYTMVGYTNPMHCTAIGKILLSAMKDAEIAALLERTGMPSYTPHTVTSPDVLMAQVRKARKSGYSTEYAEHAVGSACIAAPIRGISGKIIAGVSISGKFCGERMKDREEEAAAIVMEAAALISHKLGRI